MNVVNFGSLNIDHVYAVDHFCRAGETIHTKSYTQNAGGKGLNQSIAVSRSGQKVNQAVTPQEIDEVLMQLNAGDYLLLQNEIANLTYLLRAAARRGLRVVLNASPISDELLNADLSGVDWLVVNEIECAAMAGCGDAQAGYETLKQRYPSLGILLTLGSEGSVSWKDGTEVRQCAYPVKAVDTTGAGDTFMGYFVGCLAQGMERQTAMQYASMASAISVTRPGAAASIPLMDEVRAAVEAL